MCQYMHPLTVRDALRLHEKIASCSSSPEQDHGQVRVERCCAMTSGQNYCMLQKQSAFKVRTSWPVPKGMRTMHYDDQSADGCSKKREYVIGHKAKTGMFIWICMRHQTVVGFHVYKHGEGRRDPLMSLYKFKYDAPSQVFIDCACLSEESALNWLPEFFIKTQFFHDVFHGFAHVCSRRYSHKFQTHMSGYNTSIMEQFNSFLQPLRALVCSGTTKVFHMQANQYS